MSEPTPTQRVTALDAIVQGQNWGYKDMLGLANALALELADQTQAAKDATDFNSELLKECATERAAREQVVEQLKRTVSAYELELKRGKAHGTEAVLGKCPQCLAWTVMLDMMACLKCDWSVAGVQKKAEQELAALKLKLDVAKVALRQINDREFRVYTRGGQNETFKIAHDALNKSE